MKENKNEEILSRRGFFKRAAKGTLPILGGIVLASLPIIPQQVMAHCGNSCYAGCDAQCANNCSSSCTGSCYGCSHTCTGICTGCGGMCQESCIGSAK